MDTEARKQISHPIKHEKNVSKMDIWIWLSLQYENEIRTDLTDDMKYTLSAARVHTVLTIEKQICQLKHEVHCTSCAGLIMGNNDNLMHVQCYKCSAEPQTI